MLEALSRRRLLFGLGASCSLAALVLLRAAPVLADTGAGASEIQEVAERFAAGLSEADATAVASESTDAAYARLRPRLETSPTPAPGSFGTFEVIRAGLLKADLAVAYVICDQPDGVRDLLNLTLVRQADGWKVAGGLGSMSPPDPLGRQ